jgi:plasmid stability protein
MAFTSHATSRVRIKRLRVTLIYAKAKETRNLTLNLPEALLRRFRIYAATHDQSMTQLITIAIQRMLAEEDSWETSGRRLVDRMAKAKDRGTNGVITWTRDEIHER